MTHTSVVNRPRLSFWQIWNMSFGFMGIQFGLGLQNANTSRIFSTLGANADEIPILWIAAPITGMLVQPVIGYLSDRTWHTTWGRRRPFFFLGSVLASLALILMPNSSELWMAGTVLWLMDASINISMEPFRAFVGDLLPSEQRTAGFAMQSFFIGVGAVIASALPAILSAFGVSNTADVGKIPDAVRWSYYIGAAVFFICVLYTVLTSREYPPEDLEAFRREHARVRLSDVFREAYSGLFQMPKVMKQLAAVQFFTWFGLFCMWIFMTNAVTQHLYGTTDPQSKLYNEGADFVGIAMAMYNGVAALFALFLPYMASKLGRKVTHLLCLSAGGLGLISIYFIEDPNLVLLSMTGVGIAWTSILSIPYAMLAGSLPADRMGFFMGVFNFFIVLPQVVASLGLAALARFLGLQPIQVIVMGGVLLMIAGLLSLRISDEENLKPNLPS
ncbi:MFS transporter [Siphonobacter sp. SORGH_AS_0500]|uniref:MFS transporter n=1 Tax=Siphonobacter sp. SORGH_AS_0500 TaxID=1864824 RepID=UPI00285B73A6|nr:MFS transporter [Siphonobacter sp. SORGH_AS_0500]MDR6195083.1 maltose/moltooligosaccharide transporter [Siphonobacter sp. SORGH_AS_0500]